MVKTIERMLEPARSTDDFVLHLTNRHGAHGFGNDVSSFLEQKEDRGREYKVNFRDDTKRSLIVDLLDPVTY